MWTLKMIELGCIHRYIDMSVLHGIDPMHDPFLNSAALGGS